MLRSGGCFDEEINKCDMSDLIAEIGKQSPITKKQINAYTAAFLVEGIADRDALFRCKEDDVMLIITKCGMNIGHKNAMIDLWLAREAKADEESPIDGPMGLLEVTDE